MPPVQQIGRGRNIAGHAPEIEPLQDPMKVPAAGQRKGKILANLRPGQRPRSDFSGRMRQGPRFWQEKLQKTAEARTRASALANKPIFAPEFGCPPYMRSGGKTLRKYIPIHALRKRRAAHCGCLRPGHWGIPPGNVLKRPKYFSGALLRLL